MYSRQRSTALALVATTVALATALMVAQPVSPARSAPSQPATYAAMEDRIAEALENRIADSGASPEIQAQMVTLARQLSREIAVDMVADNGAPSTRNIPSGGSEATEAAVAGPRNRALAMPYFSFSPDMRRGANRN